MNIVLVEPEIPQNTGNIIRTCAATNSGLHLIKPLGFSMEDKFLKRAGLDYWSMLKIHIYNNYDEFAHKNRNGNFYFLTTKAKKSYDSFEFSNSPYLIFGKETAGLSEKLLDNNKEKCMRIPMIKDSRSLNLSNAVAIVLYEALRQKGFTNLL